MRTVAADSPPLRCWGSIIAGSGCCPSDFKPGTNHFKNKFCASCRSGGLLVPADRVRAIKSDQHGQLINSGASGCWGVAGYRMANQTKKCSGPWLIIFPDQVPFIDGGWAPIPEEWLHRDGLGGAARLHLLVSKGTLIPLDAAASLAVRGAVGSGGGGLATHGPVVHLATDLASELSIPALWAAPSSAAPSSTALDPLAELLGEDFVEDIGEGLLDACGGWSELEWLGGEKLSVRCAASVAAAAPTGPTGAPVLSPGAPGAQLKRGRSPAPADGELANRAVSASSQRVRTPSEQNAPPRSGTDGTLASADRLSMYVQQHRGMCELLQTWLDDEARLPAAQVAALRSQLAVSRGVLAAADSGELDATWSTAAAATAPSDAAAIAIAIADTAAPAPPCGDALHAPLLLSSMHELASVLERPTIQDAMNRPRRGQSPPSAHATWRALCLEVPETTLERIYASFRRLLAINGRTPLSAGAETGAEADDADIRTWHVLIEAHPDVFVRLFPTLQGLASAGVAGREDASVVRGCIVDGLLSPRAAVHPLHATVDAGAAVDVAMGSSSAAPVVLEASVAAGCTGTSRLMLSHSATDTAAATEDIVRQLASLRLPPSASASPAADTAAADATTLQVADFDSAAVAALFDAAARLPPHAADGRPRWRLVCHVDGSHACEEATFSTEEIPLALRARLSSLLAGSRQLALFRSHLVADVPAHIAARNYRRLCEQGTPVNEFAPGDTLRDWTSLPADDEAPATMARMTGRAFLRACAWIWTSLSGRLLYRTAQCANAQLSVRYDDASLAPDWRRPHVNFTTARPVDGAPERCVLDVMELQLDGVMSRLQLMYGYSANHLASIRLEMEQRRDGE